MKKFVRVLAVIALVLVVVGLVRTNPAWADAFTGLPFSAPRSGEQAIDSTAAQPTSIIVTGTGSYLVGGVCKFDTTYVATDIKNQVDAEVPIAISQTVPYGGSDDLYYPGCHVVHYKLDKVVELADGKDGDWKICFGKRPDIELVVYFYKYNDTQPDGTVSWVELPTSVEGDYSCAPAYETGVYMPSGRVIQDSFSYDRIEGHWVRPPQVGSVKPPAYWVDTSQSGSYGVGGICSIDAFYKVDFLRDETYVEFLVEDNQIINYPENGDLLFFPGCHVLHFEKDEVQKQMTNEKGIWEICFAAPPGRQMTIYFYESMIHIDEHERMASPWTPLPTTVENGLACAPAEFTGVYVPAGK